MIYFVIYSTSNFGKFTVKRGFRPMSNAGFSQTGFDILYVSTYLPVQYIVEWRPLCNRSWMFLWINCNSIFVNISKFHVYSYSSLWREKHQHFPPKNFLEKIKMSILASPSLLTIYCTVHTDTKVTDFPQYKMKFLNPSSPPPLSLSARLLASCIGLNIVFNWCIWPSVILAKD